MGSVEAIWLGGPQDGKPVMLPEGTHSVRVPVLMNFPEWWWDDEMTVGPTEPLVIRAITCPVIHDEWGYHILWHEPS